MKNLLQIIVVFVVFFQGTELKAQSTGGIYKLSVGRTSARDLDIVGEDLFKSDNTICVDLGGGGYFYLGEKRVLGLGLGLAAELGVKSIEMASASHLLDEGKKRKAKLELSVGPALYRSSVNWISIICPAELLVWRKIFYQ